jgi:hypothetical protein
VEEVDSMNSKHSAIVMSRAGWCRLAAKNLVVICCTLLGLISPAYPAKVEQGTIKSVRQFVQGFYDWYVPKALSSSPGPPWGAALQARPSNFSTEIASLLRKEMREQAHTPGEISGLDFDPFLSTQDPDDRYNVGEIVKKGESYWVSVYGASTERSQPPTLVAEVSHVDGRWQFTNFRYANGKDFVSLLKAIRHSTNSRSE